MKQVARWAMVIGVLTFAAGCSIRDVREDPLFEICHNGAIDEVETDVDCGGSCGPCEMGKSCKRDADCTTNACIAGRCDDPSCRNQEQDNAETDVDCGGDKCPACPAQKGCNRATDCKAGNLCLNGLCYIATCADGKQNGSESDIDCGDLTNLCARCATGATCMDNANCESKHCVGGYCAASRCDDGIVNGKETSKDCGGGCPTRCPDGSPCTQLTDCSSSVCKAGFCSVASCSDGVSNGQETGVDCGGSCLPQTCGNGQICTSNVDCTYGNCAAGTCQQQVCANGQFDSASETDKDCGGLCQPCGINQNCITDADCESKICDSVAKKCAPPTCSDRAQNGNETDVNCGGPTCTQRCGIGQKCLTSADCESKVCDIITNKCLAPT